jgi:thiol-disulfide isomerase/thioredoxin
MKITWPRALIVLSILALSAAGFVVLHSTIQAHPRVVPAQKSTANAKVDAKNVPVIYFVKDPEYAPPFELHDLSGGVLTPAALKGKVVLLNFWATWCGPCREEIPEMIALQAQYKDSLQVIGISEDEDPPDKVEKFAKKMGMNYPVAMATPELERGYGVIAALPTTFVIDPQGRVMQKHEGVYSFDFYNTEVRSLMGLPVDAHVETFDDTGQIFVKNATLADLLPGVKFTGLTPAQKKAALHRMNAEYCTCGCGMTIAQCRADDPSCDTSRSLALKIVREITHGGSQASSAQAKTVSSTQN